MHLIREELIAHAAAAPGRGALARRLPRGQAAHRPLRVRRGAAAGREGLLRDRPRPLQRPRRQARHPRRGRVLHQRRQRSASRPSCAPWWRASASPARRRPERERSRSSSPDRDRRRSAWATRWPRPCPRAAAVFDEADAALGFPLSRLCFEGPEERADSSPPTRSPPSSPPAWRPAARAGRARREAGLGGRPQPGRVLGAGRRGRAGRCATPCVAVRRRGQYMQEAVPVGEGAMAAILGLDRRVGRGGLPRGRPGPGGVARQRQLAGPGGHRRARRRRGARDARPARPRAPSAPSGCPCPRPSTAPLMKPAQERLAGRPGARRASRDPPVPLVNNVDARRGAHGRGVPRRAGAAGVGAGALAGVGARRWCGEGVDTFVEVGPGQRAVAAWSRRSTRRCAC